jgi:hypothetical protein
MSASTQGSVVFDTSHFQDIALMENRLIAEPTIQNIRNIRALIKLYVEEITLLSARISTPGQPGMEVLCDAATHAVIVDEQERENYYREVKRWRESRANIADRRAKLMLKKNRLDQVLRLRRKHKWFRAEMKEALPRIWDS